MHPTLTSRLLPWGLVFELVYFSVLRTFDLSFHLRFQFGVIFVLFPLGTLSPSSFQPVGIELRSNSNTSDPATPNPFPPYARLVSDVT